MDTVEMLDSKSESGKFEFIRNKPIFMCHEEEIILCGGFDLQNESIFDGISLKVDK